GRTKMASSSLTVSVSDFMPTSSPMAGSRSSPERCRRLPTFGGADRFARVGSARGNDRPDLCPDLGSTLDLEAASQFCRALAHRVVHEMPHVVAVRLDADSFIAAPQPHLVVI